MDIKTGVFIPPKCDVIFIEKRKHTYGKMYKIFRNDGKVYNITGRSHRYDNNKNLFVIRTYGSNLPLMLEVEKEYIIDNRK